MVFLNKAGHECFVIIVVVDDMQFVSHSMPMLDILKKKLQSKFDVKLCSAIASFIGW